MVEYYSMNLYKKNLRVHLVEDKSLNLDQYTLRKTTRTGWVYVHNFMKKQEWIGCPDSEIAVPYTCYEIYFVSYNTVNDSSVDGFSYNDYKKKIFYGSSGIYAYKKGNTFYELVTGDEILDSSEHIIREIKFARDFINMREDLTRVYAHLDLYKAAFREITEKLLFSHSSYVNAYYEYERKVQIYRNESEKKARQLRFLKDQEKISNEINVIEEEREKIQQLVLSIKTL